MRDKQEADRPTDRVVFIQLVSLQSSHQHMMPDSPSPTTPLPIPDDEESADLPLPLSASLVLTSLPQDAQAALEKAAGDVDGIPPKGLPATPLLLFFDMILTSNLNTPFATN